MSAADNSCQQQHGTANRQLPARDDHRRLSLCGKFADDCAAAGRSRREEHKAFAGQRHPAAQAVQRTQRDNQHADKSEHTAHGLRHIEPVIGKQTMRDAHGEKRRHRRNDRALDAGCVRQSNIEKYILHGRLHETQQQNARPLRSCRNNQLAACDNRNHKHCNACQHEPPAGKKQFARRFVPDAKQRIARLDRRKGTAPQQGAKQRRQCQADEIFLFHDSTSFYLKCPCSILLHPMCNYKGIVCIFLLSS